MSAGRGRSWIVGRDSECKLVTSCTSSLFAKNALVAEALAMREALSLTTNIQATSILLESDCMELIEMCRGNLIRREIEHIVKDKLLLKDNFTSDGFLGTRRDGNRVADLEAKLGSLETLSRN